MDEIVIDACRPGEIGRALEILHSQLPRDEQQAMIASMQQWLQTDPAAAEGLQVARDLRGVRGAVLIQEQPGRTAILWAPGTSPEDRGLDARLAETADERLAARAPVLAQSLLAVPAGPQAAALEAIGFIKLTELEYLIASTRPAETVHRSDQIRFETYRPTQRKRLAALVEATYVDTLDCPQLDGIRDIDDVINGYQATGEFDPGRWFFVVQDGRDAGVLLLTEHAGTNQWELVYMGVVPEARGRGIGQAMGQFALHRAFEAHAEAILLAVDADNRYAVDLYRRLGFRVWNRRIVYLKIY